jgi:putative endonuclease
MANRREEGKIYEQMALDYLTTKGYRLISRNFQFGRTGEIDLIMRDGPIYVFVEVKARKTHIYGTPEDSVTEVKRRQIRRVAEGFVHIMKLTDFEGRFDMIAIDFQTGKNGEPEIRHHIDAFR